MGDGDLDDGIRAILRSRSISARVGCGWRRRPPELCCELKEGVVRMTGAIPVLVGVVMELSTVMSLMLPRGAARGLLREGVVAAGGLGLGGCGCPTNAPVGRPNGSPLGEVGRWGAGAGALSTGFHVSKSLADVN